jgi:hypothetical protein
MTLTGATWVEGLVDRSTNASALTSFGSPTWGSQGRTFDGTGDYIVAPTMATLIGSGEYTVVIWVKFTDLTTDHYINYLGTAASNADYLLVYVPTASKLPTIAGRSGGSGLATATSLSAITTNIWYCIIATRTGTTGQITLDNVEGTAVTNAEFGVTVGAEHTIGDFRIAGQAAGSGTTGIIGEYLLYNRVLSLPEKVQIRNATRRRYGV